MNVLTLKQPKLVTFPAFPIVSVQARKIVIHFEEETKQIIKNISKKTFLYAFFIILSSPLE